MTENVIRWFTTAQAAHVAGLSVHMVNYLCRTAIVRPGALPKRGHGRIRRFGYDDVLLLRVLAKLLENGISVLKLKRGLQVLAKRGQLTTALSSRFLVTDGRALYLLQKGLVESLETGQLAFAFVLELNSLRAEVNRRVSRLAA